jgi:hypothetical protein
VPRVSLSEFSLEYTMLSQSVTGGGGSLLRLAAANMTPDYEGPLTDVPMETQGEQVRIECWCSTRLVRMYVLAVPIGHDSDGFLQAPSSCNIVEGVGSIEQRVDA